MSTPSPHPNSNASARVLVSATLIGGLLLTGCSSGTAEEVSPANAAAATQSATNGEATDTADLEASDPADAADSPADELPDGFPNDVPLPAYTGSHTIGSSDGDFQFWSILLELADHTETPVEDYAANLEDAGYTLEDSSGGSVTAEGPDWEIDFHSSADNTLTLAVQTP
ncbi:hypothetical protein [Demequina aurantiaca]|uniref:hypothetical protein n=1 Tax=Demequina aurantiaca TaxID=676200 RepID=UPI003D33ADF9